MVAPVNSTTGLNSLLRTQQAGNVSQTANRQIAQVVLNKTPAVVKSSKSPAISLASANSSPPPNLPRGSIVDKLV